MFFLYDVFYNCACIKKNLTCILNVALIFMKEILRLLRFNCLFNVCYKTDIFLYILNIYTLVIFLIVFQIQGLERDRNLHKTSSLIANCL